MQSTALALISCEQTRGEIVHTEMPRYDAIIYCDLCIEPAWVPEQVKFIEAACWSSGIPFYILRSDLYRDYMKNFGVNRVSAMPFWTLKTARCRNWDVVLSQLQLMFQDRLTA